MRKETNIPKVLHYCWFGEGEQNDSMKRCIKSWKKFCPEYEIIQWDESNFDHNACEFSKHKYKNKRWAFVSDYARLKVLHEYGGIYLDTDMELIKPIEPLLEKSDCFFGYENDQLVSCGIIGAKRHHPFIEKLLDYYTKREDTKETPVTDIVTDIYFDTCEAQMSVKVYPSTFFYPLPYAKKFDSSYITNNTYGIHWWEASWKKSKKGIVKRFFQKLTKQ